ncbi:MAG: pseudouridine synthase [Gammaproteobacteria bacterium]|nr:pseudouridine synthase [Gammaproteobacteria bacterium]
MAERLQKWLAARGLGSRRAIEVWIREGRITVDGQPAVLGQKVTGAETIRVDGERVHVPRERPAQPRSLLYHKPAGEICTRSDPAGRPTVFESLPELRGQRWISVGRLDVQTAGLLLFTTDGELAARLMHPSAGVEREYAVRVQGGLEPQAVDRLRDGVELEDGSVRCQRIEFSGGEAGNQWYRIVLTEGRNRIVRRMIEAVGARVSRLIRIRYGPLTLPRDLPRGRYHVLDARESERLYKAAGLSAPRRRARKRQAAKRSRRVKPGRRGSDR